MKKEKPHHTNSLLGLTVRQFTAWLDDVSDYFFVARPRLALVQKLGIFFLSGSKKKIESKKVEKKGPYSFQISIVFSPL